ncbi:hypothetical protein ACJMK2_036463 [Sinanodonta woodiana]|uniref:Uncharacterized protein n=1 Tax=Sinanodonta woodiana TaxID=1069815 RepID=A0ABD3WIK5_SINWO
MRGLAVFMCIFLCMTATMMVAAESQPVKDVALIAPDNVEGSPAKGVTDWANCLANVSNTDINIRRTLFLRKMRGLAVFMCIFLCMTATMMDTAESLPAEDVSLSAPDNGVGSPAKGEKRLCTSWVCFYL